MTNEYENTICNNVPDGPLLDKIHPSMETKALRNARGSVSPPREEARKSEEQRKDVGGFPIIYAF